MATEPTETWSGVEVILNREFPPEWKGVPTLDDLAAMRVKLVEALPVDASVDVTQYMNVIVLRVRYAGRDFNRTAKVAP